MEKKYKCKKCGKEAIFIFNDNFNCNPSIKCLCKDNEFECKFDKQIDENIKKSTEFKIGVNYE